MAEDARRGTKKKCFVGRRQTRRTRVDLISCGCELTVTGVLESHVLCFCCHGTETCSIEHVNFVVNLIYTWVIGVQMFVAPNKMLDGSNVGSRETNGVTNLLQIGTEIISHLASKYSLISCNLDAQCNLITVSISPRCPTNLHADILTGPNLISLRTSNS